MAKLFYHDKPIIGLEIAQTGIKVMAIDPKKWVVLAYGNIDLDPTKLQESIEKSTDYLTKGIQQLLKDKVVGTLPSNRIVMSTPTTRTFSRSISLPVTAADNLLEAIQIESEQYIPIPVSELYIDYEVIEHGKENLEVLMCAVPKRIVDTCVNACEQAGLEVVMVESGISAVARLVTATEEGKLPTVIIDIGAASTDIAILDKTIRVTGGLAVGGHNLTLDIAKTMSLSLEAAHQLKIHSGLMLGPKQAAIKRSLDPSLSKIVAETKKIIRYYNERIGGKTKLEQIIVVGGGSNVPGLGEYFTEAMLMPARVASPWQRLNFGKLTQPPRQFKPRFITAAGLAVVKPKEIWS